MLLYVQKKTDKGYIVKNVFEREGRDMTLAEMQEMCSRGITIHGFNDVNEVVCYESFMELQEVKLLESDLLTDSVYTNMSAKGGSYMHFHACDADGRLLKDEEGYLIETETALDIIMEDAGHCEDGRCEVPVFVTVLDFKKFPATFDCAELKIGANVLTVIANLKEFTVDQPSDAVITCWKKVDMSECIETTIDMGTFAGCKQLSEFLMPRYNNCDWGSGLLTDAKSLQNIVLPEGLFCIPRYFLSFSGLQTVEIPKGCGYIGEYAFSHCDQLVSVTFPIGEQIDAEQSIDIGDGVFSHCGSLQSVQLSDATGRIGKSAFEWCTKLETFFVPNSCRSIGDKAFNFASIMKLRLPSKFVKLTSEHFRLRRTCGSQDEFVPFTGEPFVMDSSTDIICLWDCSPEMRKFLHRVGASPSVLAIPAIKGFPYYGVFQVIADGPTLRYNAMLKWLVIEPPMNKKWLDSYTLYIDEFYKGTRSVDKFYKGARFVDEFYKGWC